jgi:hypothetical protein
MTECEQAQSTNTHALAFEVIRQSSSEIALWTLLSILPFQLFCPCLVWISSFALHLHALLWTPIAIFWLTIPGLASTPSRIAAESYKQ